MYCADVLSICTFTESTVPLVFHSYLLLPGILYPFLVFYIYLVTCHLHLTATGKTRNYVIPDILFNSQEEFCCSDYGLYKYKVLQCTVAQV